MMRPTHVSRSCFMSPEVFVLVNQNAVAEPRLFHWVTTDQIDGKHAVRCFLSFSDALLSAALSRAIGGMAVAPAKATEIGIEAFRVGDEYLAILQVGWAAHQGKLLVSTEGVLATFGMPLRQPVSSTAPSFEVDERTLEMIGGLYEYAGISAWREMARVHEDAAVFLRAVGGLQIAQLGAVEQDQYAFFNSISGEWHFLPVNGPSDEIPGLLGN